MKTSRVDTASGARNRKPLISAAAFALVSIVLCVLAGGIAGRALWCDEILRINGQSMSVAQLMRFEHLKTFCTQTTAGYLFMRPWQLLFVLFVLFVAIFHCCFLGQGVEWRHEPGR